MRILMLTAALALASTAAQAIDKKVFTHVPEEPGFYFARGSYQKVPPNKFRIWEAAVPKDPVESDAGTIDEIYWFAEYDCTERTKSILQRNAYYQGKVVPQAASFERPPPGLASFVRPGTMSSRVLRMCDPAEAKAEQKADAKPAAKSAARK
jgi:hypothetical protein